MSQNRTKSGAKGSEKKTTEEEEEGVKNQNVFADGSISSFPGSCCTSKRPERRAKLRVQRYRGKKRGRSRGSKN